MSPKYYFCYGNFITEKNINIDMLCAIFVCLSSLLIKVKCCVCVCGPVDRVLDSRSEGLGFDTTAGHV